MTCGQSRTEQEAKEIPKVPISCRKLFGCKKWIGKDSQRLNTWTTQKKKINRHSYDWVKDSDSSPTTLLIVTTRPKLTQIILRNLILPALKNYYVTTKIIVYCGNSLLLILLYYNKLIFPSISNYPQPKLLSVVFICSFIGNNSVTLTSNFTNLNTG